MSLIVLLSVCGRFVSTEDNVDISHSVFSGLLSSNEHGGAININRQNTFFKLAFSLFFGCKVASGYNGGAIFCECSKSGLVFMEKVCSSDCFTLGFNYGQFFHISLQGTNFSRLEYVSVTRCLYSPNRNYDTIRFINGNEEIKNTNSSKNTQLQGSGMLVWNGNTYYIGFCTVSNNTDDNYRTIYVFYGNNAIISNSNIIFNNPGLSSNGQIICVESIPCTIEQCVFYHNTCKHLIAISSTTVTVKDCTVDILNSNNPVLLQTNNNIVSKPLIIPIIHFSTIHCQAEKPLIHYTKVNKVPKSSPLLYFFTQLVF